MNVNCAPVGGAAAAKRLPLRSLSQLTWAEFVRGVRCDTVELPAPWSYPKDRVGIRNGRRVFTDSIIDFPAQYSSVAGESTASSILLLHHPESLLIPYDKGEDAYVLGPFDVALVVSDGDDVHWSAVRTGSNRAGGAHPNLFPDPCYGCRPSDWCDLFDGAARDCEWGDILFLIHRFLNSWNPQDTPMGHPGYLAVDRRPYSGPVLSELGRYTSTVLCAGCVRTVNGDDVIYVEGGMGDLGYCQGCFDELFTYCSHCDTIVVRDYATLVASEDYCDQCCNQFFLRCVRCDEYQPREDYPREQVGDLVCRDCLAKEVEE